MKVFKIEILNASYDEYDGFAVFAENEEDAIRLIKTEYSLYSIRWDDGYEITEIKPDKSKVILDSFIEP